MRSTLQSWRQQTQSHGTCTIPQSCTPSWRCCKWCRWWRWSRSNEVECVFLNAKLTVRKSSGNYDWSWTTGRGTVDKRVVQRNFKGRNSNKINPTGVWCTSSEKGKTRNSNEDCKACEEIRLIQIWCEGLHHGQRKDQRHQVPSEISRR